MPFISVRNYVWLSVRPSRLGKIFILDGYDYLHCSSEFLEDFEKTHGCFEKYLCEFGVWLYNKTVNITFNPIEIDEGTLDELSNSSFFTKIFVVVDKTISSNGKEFFTLIFRLGKKEWLKVL